MTGADLQSKTAGAEDQAVRIAGVWLWTAYVWDQFCGLNAHYRLESISALPVLFWLKGSESLLLVWRVMAFEMW